jgi:hypothetical protein
VKYFVSFLHQIPWAPTTRHWGRSWEAQASWPHSCLASYKSLTVHSIFKWDYIFLLKVVIRTRKNSA